MVIIEASAKNTSEYELLAGPVSVFMDGGFVTKTSLGVSPSVTGSLRGLCPLKPHGHALQLISANESFECVLGVATALRVAYHTSASTVHEPARSFAEPTKTTSTVWTTVANKHMRDVTGPVMRDMVPLGNEEAEIKVMLRRSDDLALAKAGEEVAIMLVGLSACERREGAMGLGGPGYEEGDEKDRKSTRLNSSHSGESRMPSSA